MDLDAGRTRYVIKRLAPGVPHYFAVISGYDGRVADESWSEWVHLTIPIPEPSLPPPPPFLTPTSYDYTIEGSGSARRFRYLLNGDYTVSIVSGNGAFVDIGVVILNQDAAEPVLRRGRDGEYAMHITESALHTIVVTDRHRHRASVADADVWRLVIRRTSSDIPYAPSRPLCLTCRTKPADRHSHL